ncbi:hypothetical protein TCAL_13353, partial [Tigriopus californicus]|eukprot:TCALIF_13353-PA protein Name:"Similar to SULT1C4 Sulfotransferase 1C4 (Homo sapiens)" AED:0.11 eAED:0.11 QI:147/0.8/0.5/1/0.8/0.66/6/0/331
MGENDFPFTFQTVSREDEEAKRKVFKEGSLELNVTQVMPGRIILPKTYEEDAKRIYNMELRPDDIWIVTYPKCGTTWTQESVWQLVNFDLNSNIPFDARTPFLEFGHIMKSSGAFEIKVGSKEPPPEMFTDLVSFIGKMQSPRVIKTHIPLELLPPKLVETCKVVYVCRNPKDTCVSYFHHSAIGKPVYKLYGNFEDYSELFFNGRLVYGDYWQHLKSGWALRGHENFKFIWFEDMKQDHKAGLKDLAQFLGYERTEEELDTLVKHLTIDNMRNISVAKARNDYEKEFLAKFFRKGQVGDWSNYFQGETLQKWNEWIKKHLEGTDIVMRFK